MLFRKKKASTAGESTSLKKKEEVTLKICLDYFAGFNGTCQNIVAQIRQFLLAAEREKTSVDPGKTFDQEINKIFISEKVKLKYKLSDADFDLSGAAWFPRLTTYKQYKHADDDSISSSTSVWSHIRDILLFFSAIVYVSFNIKF